MAGVALGLSGGVDVAIEDGVAEGDGWSVGLGGKGVPPDAVAEAPGLGNPAMGVAVGRYQGERGSLGLFRLGPSSQKGIENACA